MEIPEEVIEHIMQAYFYMGDKGCKEFGNEMRLCETDTERRELIRRIIQKRIDERNSEVG